MSKVRNIVLIGTAVVATLAVATSADAATVKVKGNAYTITQQQPIGAGYGIDLSRLMGDKLRYWKGNPDTPAYFTETKNQKWVTVASRIDETGKRVYQQKSSLKIAGKNITVYRTYTNAPIITKPAKFVSQTGHKYYKMVLGPLTTKPVNIKNVSASFTSLDGHVASGPQNNAYLTKSFKLKTKDINTKHHFWPGIYEDWRGWKIGRIPNNSGAEKQVFTLANDYDFAKGAHFIPMNFYTPVKGGWRQEVYFWAEWTGVNNLHHGVVYAQSDVTMLKDSTVLAKKVLTNDTRVFGSYNHAKLEKQLKMKEALLAKAESMEITDEKTRDAALKMVDQASPYSKDAKGEYLESILNTDPRQESENKSNIALAKKYGATEYLKKINALAEYWRVDYPRYDKLNKNYSAARDEIWTKYWASKNMTVKVQSASTSSIKSSSVATFSSSESSKSSSTSSQQAASQSTESMTNQTSTSAVDNTTQSDVR
jgi:hypothetical protein